MIHYIIVKFNDRVTDKEGFCDQIGELFQPAVKIPGILEVRLFRSCIDRPNRHDLMIRMELEPEALAVFDGSEIHRLWKEQFGEYLEGKTIFDHE